VRIAEWLEQVQAQGLAPLASALEGAFADFTADPAHRNSVVILSSGVDSCGRNPCAAVRELEARGIHVDVHVIALGVDPDAVGQLACIAEQSGGALREVRDEKALRDALDEVAKEIAATPTAVPLAPQPAPAATTPPAPAPPPGPTAMRTPAPPSPRTPGATLPATTVAPTPSRMPTTTTVPTVTGTPYVEAIGAVNVRAGPGLNYPIIGQLRPGDRVTPLAAYLYPRQPPSCAGPRDGAGRLWYHPDFDKTGWITVAMPHNDIPSGQSRFYRAHFDLPGTTPQAALRFKSDDGTQACVNGLYVGRWGADCGYGGTTAPPDVDQTFPAANCAFNRSAISGNPAGSRCESSNVSKSSAASRRAEARIAAKSMTWATSICSSQARGPRRRG
jgi:hypothetical protein